MEIAGGIFKAECDLAGLVISDKTCVVADSAALREEVAADMQELGIPASALEAAVDLGVETTAGTKRRRGRWRKRRKAASCEDCSLEMS